MQSFVGHHADMLLFIKHNHCHHHRVLGFFVVIAMLYTSIGIGIAIGQYYWVLDIGCISWYRSNPTPNRMKPSPKTYPLCCSICIRVVLNTDPLMLFKKWPLNGKISKFGFDMMYEEFFWGHSFICSCQFCWKLTKGKQQNNALIHIQVKSPNLQHCTSNMLEQFHQKIYRVIVSWPQILSWPQHLPSSVQIYLADENKDVKCQNR